MILIMQYKILVVIYEDACLDDGRNVKWRQWSRYDIFSKNVDGKLRNIVVARNRVKLSKLYVL